MMVTWVKEAWKRLAPEVIIRSFEVCGIMSSDPDILHCTKKGEVAEAAREALLCDVGDVDLDATDVILDANRQTPEDSEEDDTSETLSTLAIRYLRYLNAFMHLTKYYRVSYEILLCF